MFGLLKKQVVTDVAIKDGSELNAIAKLAGFASEKLDIAAQTVRSGFLATEAQGATIIADHIVLTHASSEAVKQPEPLIMTLAAPIAWGDGAQVDTLVGVVVPADADTSAIMAQIKAHLSAQADQYATANASALEKLRRQL
ncbi:PTS sugar transporter subunit IIA [Lacticaseibacillus jixiensis]|uniref:PTS sugar transporter subunit IIA n=1 Tax=Lacticaseibacillus jixiensis TaxID=3231926 RepID=UPI0036F3A656